MGEFVPQTNASGTLALNGTLASPAPTTPLKTMIEPVVIAVVFAVFTTETRSGLPFTVMVSGTVGSYVAVPQTTPLIVGNVPSLKVHVPTGTLVKTAPISLTFAESTLLPHVRVTGKVVLCGTLLAAGPATSIPTRTESRTKFMVFVTVTLGVLPVVIVSVAEGLKVGVAKLSPSAVGAASVSVQLPLGTFWKTAGCAAYAFMTTAEWPAHVSEIEYGKYDPVSALAVPFCMTFTSTVLGRMLAVLVTVALVVPALVTVNVAEGLKLGAAQSKAPPSIPSGGDSETVQDPAGAFRNVAA
jgi:hypothetical protein